MSDPTYIIAEAGVNHNGYAELAFKLVDAAAGAGADAVKFQTFKAGNVVTIKAEKAEYQQKTTDASESQYAMLKQLELSYEIHQELIKYCREKSIDFLSTAFDFESLDFLTHELKLTTLKIPSGEITNGPLLLAHAQTGANLIVSTGMATMNEVEDALGVIAFGLLNKQQPSVSAFKEAYLSSEGQQLLQEKVTLLHCTTEYPAPFNDINLNAMLTMQNVFGLTVGYSDHSEGIVVPVLATALGATIIEKHFTLDKTMKGPDHKASLNPGELKEMVEAIRTKELVMGNGIKYPSPVELKNRPIARKSLIAATDIKAGEKFTDQNLTIKRPGIGISPMDYWDRIGTLSNRDYNQDDVIQ